MDDEDEVYSVIAFLGFIKEESLKLEKLSPTSLVIHRVYSEMYFSNREQSPINEREHSHQGANSALNVERQIR